MGHRHCARAHECPSEGMAAAAWVVAAPLGTDAQKRPERGELSGNPLLRPVVDRYTMLESDARDALLNLFLGH